MRALELYRDPRVPGRRLYIGCINVPDSEVPWFVAQTRERYGEHRYDKRNGVLWYPTYAAAQAAVAADLDMTSIGRTGAVTEAAFDHADVTYVEAPGLRRWRVKVGRLNYRNDAAMLVVERRRWGRWRIVPGYETLAEPITANETAVVLLDHINPNNEK